MRWFIALPAPLQRVTRLIVARMMALYPDGDLPNVRGEELLALAMTPPLRRAIDAAKHDPEVQAYWARQGA